jgi:uncharacterized protein YcaQ
MMKETRIISRTVARRMAIVAQGLEGTRPRADTERIMDVIGRLGCLQLDPITIFARSHLLVLRSRIDPTFDRSRKQLLINSVHTEPATLITAQTGRAIAAAIEELAEFLGATTISYSHQLPEGWKQILS